MNLKLYLLLSLLLYARLLQAQEQEKVWVFGDKAGVDFTSGNPIPFQSAIEGLGEASASVTDKDGRLLFYTEGSIVWNRDHQVMPNGTNLTPVISTTLYTPTSSTAQGALIIPKPGTTDQYYVFSLTSMEQAAQGNAGKLYCSVVDMSLNGGLGDVVATHKGRYIASDLSERLTAVVGDRCNIWVLTCGMDALIRAFEVTHAGVDTTPVISPVGIMQDFTGRMSVSPDGRKLAATKCSIPITGSMGLMLFDFDISTGLASSPVQLLDNYGGYGVCFSPDNSKLYMYRDLSIYQYDLSNPAPAAIRASGTRLGDCGVADIKLGPDGKVYFRTNMHVAGSVATFGVIHNPNLQGAAAGYQNNIFSTLTSASFGPGLPNTVPVFHFDPDTMYSTATHTVICFPSGVRLSAGDTTGWGYVWNDNVPGHEKTVFTTGTWWVKYFTTPCTHRVDTFNVVFPELVVYPSCRNTATGAARIIKAAGDTTSYSYTWRDAAGNIVSVSDSLSNVPAGDYRLHISSGAGCNDTVDVTVGSTEYTASFEADSLACVGVPVQFQNTSDSQPGSWYWDFGDGAISTDTAPQHVFGSPGTYEIMLVKTVDPCTDTFYRRIIVDDTSSVYFTIGNDSICVGGVILLTPVHDDRILSLVWTLDGRPADPASTGGIAYITDRAGDIIVSLTGSFRACPDASFTDTLHVFPFPVVNLGPDTAICPNAAAIVLKNAVLPQHGDRFLWSSGETDTLLPVYTPGLYYLTVTSAAGCATTDSVNIDRDCFIDIPNVFTPNGDGMNDYFFPRDLLTSRLTGFTMSVYNRWGQKVYETNQTSGRGWDGRFNGALQPEGVYAYVIIAEINGGRKERFQGSVTLLR